MDGKKPGMTCLIISRYLVFNLFQLIPNLGAMVSLVDIMLIFRADRRCLNDLVTGTQVVKSFHNGQDDAVAGASLLQSVFGASRSESFSETLGAGLLR